MTNETLWRKLFADKGVALLLCIGLVLLLVNAVAVPLTNAKLSTVLFYLDIRYWSVYLSVALWIMAMWVVFESLEVIGHHISLIRTGAIIGVLVVMIVANPLIALAVVTICCVARSFFLLHDYWYKEGKRINMEEAKWFWVMSIFLFTVSVFIGLAHVIPVRTQLHPETSTYMSVTLYQACYTGIQDMIRFGDATLWMRTLALLIVITPIAFVCLAIKWILVFFQCPSPAFMFTD